MVTKKKKEKNTQWIINCILVVYQCILNFLPFQPLTFTLYLQPLLYTCVCLTCSLVTAVHCCLSEFHVGKKECKVIFPIWCERTQHKQQCNLTLLEGEIQHSTLGSGLSLWALYLESHAQSVLGGHSPENRTPYLNKCDFDMTFSDHTGNTRGILGQNGSNKEHQFWPYKKQTLH